MSRALLKKSLHESKLLLLGCGLWLFAFSWIRVWIVSRMERSRFESILNLLGDDLVQTVSPVALTHLVSFTGRIAIGYDDALIVFVVLAFAVSRGSDIVSGELGRGTLEMLLSQPVSRLQVLAAPATVTVVCVAALALCTWLGNWVGIQTTRALVERPVTIKIPLGIVVPVPFAEPKIEAVPMRTQVDPHSLTPGAVNLFCLAVCFAGVTSFLSACDRYRWRTVGLTIAFFVLQAVLKVVGVFVGPLVTSWNWTNPKYYSVMTAYEPSRLIEIAVNDPAYAWSFSAPDASGGMGVGPLTYHCVLLGVGLLSYIAAAVVFVRRDLPAPL